MPLCCRPFVPTSNRHLDAIPCLGMPRAAAQPVMKPVPELSTGMLLNAYRHGIFPMAVDAEGTMGWFSPDPRAIIPVDDRFHISHGLKRTLKKNLFEIT